MGHNSAVLGHLIFMSFSQVDNQRTPGFWGVTFCFEFLVALYPFCDRIPLTTLVALNVTRGKLVTALRKVISF